MKVLNVRLRDAVPLSFSTGKVLIAGERGLVIEPVEGGLMLLDTMADKGAKSFFVPISNIVCMEITRDGDEGGDSLSSVGA